MQAAARLTSKGQVTIPKPIRDALRLETGDAVIFRLEGKRAALAKTPDFLDLAGSVAVPTNTRGADWPKARQVTRRARTVRRLEPGRPATT
ncbi:MAG: AbrB/MazE/SpoVT family DNA-binding domain-containing protein [Bifidobacteriaceae bacterium]|jgi:AbrB family looped-hinge helix DNA binding protein|nr:AbrB/MazE/SpoVT family DNA-binding domain-containing protein [Bifidobacteriaceae bacterium]